MYATGKLQHGGIMANYRCTAACRHCLYACSPDRDGGYVTAETAQEICSLLRKGGCSSVHIGGGEPFLDFEGLLELVRAIRRAGIGLEYVETNGFWAGEEEKARRWLNALLEEGVDALCISVDPFHAEYVPHALPLRLALLCREAGMGYFLWKQRYAVTLTKVDPDRSHSRDQLEEALSPDYILETAQSYGIGYGGRALNIEEEYGGRRPGPELLDGSPCTGLLSTGHFHVDYRGRFIPPGCTGIAIPLGEAVEGFPSGRYPAVEALLEGGVAALYTLALDRGFSPREEGYSSRCGFCFHLRHWLAEQGSCPELDLEHYRASLAWY